MQQLYLVVFVARYLDLLFPPFWSPYNSTLKLVFIASTACTVWLMRRQRCQHSDGCHAEDSRNDSFSLVNAIVPCAVLALATASDASPHVSRRQSCPPTLRLQ